MALNKNVMVADTGSQKRRENLAKTDAQATDPRDLPGYTPPAQTNGSAGTGDKTTPDTPTPTPGTTPAAPTTDTAPTTTTPTYQPTTSAKSKSKTSSASKTTTPITPAQTTIDSSKIVSRLTEGLDPVTIDRVNKYDKQPMVDMATQQIEAARQQYNNRIDNATNQGVTELRRAVSDAQAEFEAQQQQIAADEMNALDNAALYAEARGDKGGIGQAQYGSIQNTAAQNRQAVRNAQTKLATDTSRQISDLRAQGEFDKADAMLELTQTYLAELRNIEEFAANYNLNVDQINTAISQWEAEYAKSVKQFVTSTEMSIADMTGAFSDGTPTLEALTMNNNNLAEIAMSLLASGMSASKLTPAQKSALAGVYGMDAAQIAAYAKMVGAGKKSSGGGGGPYYSPGPEGDDTGYIDQLSGGDSKAPTLGAYMDAAAGLSSGTYTKEDIISQAVGAGATRAEAEARLNWALNK